MDQLNELLRNPIAQKLLIILVGAAGGLLAGLGFLVLTAPMPGTEWEIMPVVPIFLASAVTLIVVSLITPPPNEKTIKKFFP